MSPRKVVAPIGQQVAFTCTYRAKNLTEDLKIVIETENSGTQVPITDVVRLPEGDGAQTTFFAVVGCLRETIRCLILNRNDVVLGAVDVALIPGLDQISTNIRYFL